MQINNNNARKLCLQAKQSGFFLSEGRNEQLWLMIRVCENIYTVEVISPHPRTALLHSKQGGERSAEVTGESLEVKGLTGHTGLYLLTRVSFQHMHNPKAFIF